MRVRRTCGLLRMPQPFQTERNGSWRSFVSRSPSPLSGAVGAGWPPRTADCRQFREVGRGTWSHPEPLHPGVSARPAAGPEDADPRRGGAGRAPEPKRRFPAAVGRVRRGAGGDHHLSRQLSGTPYARQRPHPVAKPLSGEGGLAPLPLEPGGDGRRRTRPLDSTRSRTLAFLRGRGEQGWRTVARAVPNARRPQQAGGTTFPRFALPSGTTATMSSPPVDSSGSPRRDHA
ncbi:unnamed protein product [Rangifer tarandus platyrhynchus]|uniref:Uncharacterized protein n=2 Tax=Rangifer tarandus platyrhynchus TaxID=3082113 RepID=A0ABN8XX36_RANTA|nr:unnamed protein product [Rangifer tarandus platyrhynchus]CAI9690684.1 unnamed protein product [Rangifer tarandus platyrhynchus]